MHWQASKLAHWDASSVGCRHVLVGQVTAHLLTLPEGSQRAVCLADLSIVACQPLLALCFQGFHLRIVRLLQFLLLARFGSLVLLAELRQLCHLFAILRLHLRNLSCLRLVLFGKPLQASVCCRERLLRALQPLRYNRQDRFCLTVLMKI